MTSTQIPPAATVPELTPEGVGLAAAPDRQPEDSAAGRRPEPGGRVIRVPDVPVRKLVGMAVMGVGLLIVFFLVYLYAFTPLTASRSQQRLAQSVQGNTLFRFSLVTGRIPPEGSAVAVLTIPSLDLHQMVVSGTSASDLMQGPGLMPGSALPGSPGNAVIAGRRVTFGAPFGRIDQLRKGAVLRVADGAGRFTYRVTGRRVVTAGQRDVVDPTTDNRLTLITSDSTVVPNGRLAVQAELVGNAVAVPANAVAVPTYELGLSGDPAAGGLAVMWSLLTILVIVAAGVAVWRWRQPWLTYLLAAPIVLACALFACEGVARALPATF